MNKKARIGSKTAKGGFANEKAICKKFNNWQKDSEAQEWLESMGYKINKLTSVKALSIPTRISRANIEKYAISAEDFENFMRFKKADAQIRIILQFADILKIENLSLKKANSDADYNQVDKRTVTSYQEMWNFDDELAQWLKLFTGEILPSSQKSFKKTIIKDNRRLFFTEMPQFIQDKIIKFFDTNKVLIISDILKGRGGLSANWMLVTKYNKQNKTTDWALHEINEVMNFYSIGKVLISPKGSLTIGKITMQRKGGTPDPTKLQFKFKPCELFKLENYGSK